MSRAGCIIAQLIPALAVAALILFQEGAEWRIPEDRRHPSSDDLRAAETALCGPMASVAQETGQSSDHLVTCARDAAPGAPSLYVWGDSHARHLIGGLASTYEGEHIRILYFTSCLAQSGIGAFEYDYDGRAALAEACRMRNRKALAYFRDHPPTRIILHQYHGYTGQFSDAWFDATREIIDALQASGHKVALIGGVPQPGSRYADCLPVPETIPDIVRDQRCAFDKTLQDRIFAENRRLSEVFPDIFVDPTPSFCSTGGPCTGTLGDTLLFRDAHHLSVEGSRHLFSDISPRLEDIF